MNNTPTIQRASRLSRFRLKKLNEYKKKCAQYESDIEEGKLYLQRALEEGIKEKERADRLEGKGCAY